MHMSDMLPNSGLGANVWYFEPEYVMSVRATMTSLVNVIQQSPSVGNRGVNCGRHMSD